MTKIPQGVSEERASFGMLGVISLHGIRCCGLTFGGRVAVIGLGLLGQLALQILRAYGDLLGHGRRPDTGSIQCIFGIPVFYQRLIDAFPKIRLQNQVPLA